MVEWLTKYDINMLSSSWVLHAIDKVEWLTKLNGWVINKVIWLSNLSGKPNHDKVNWLTYVMSAPNWLVDKFHTFSHIINT